MKRITMVGWFIGMLTLSMNAQFIESSSSGSSLKTTDVENQNRPSASLQELLVRYQSLGKQAGSISQFFTKEEQIALRAFLNAEKDANLNGAWGTANMNSERTVQLPKAYFNTTIAPLTEEVYGMRSSTGFNPYSTIVPFTGTYGGPSSNATASLIYDNGGFTNQPGTPNLSVLQSSLGMTTLGAGVQFSAGNSVADEVIFTQGGEITSIDTYVYQTGTAAPSITGFYMRVWDGDPSGGTASIVWGDLVTNILDGNSSINTYRVSETTLTDRNREIQKVTGITTGLTFDAGTYWFEYTFAGSGSSGPWAVPITIAGQATTGNAIQNVAGAWQALVDGGSLTAQGVPFQLYGNMTGGGTFPEPYCGPIEFSSTVEPITLVSVAGINNISDATIDGSPAHEDFTTIEGDMEIGDSYAIALEGNTNGGFTNRFAVFIDWNQNGILNDAGEVFEIIETINGSTGADGQQATGMIEVPADALVGATRMRVKKIFGTSNYLDPCLGGSWGQAEDYTINVTDGGGGNPGPLTTVYGINNADQDLIGFGTGDPQNAEVFGTSLVTSNFENAGAIDPANPTTGYVLDNAGQFYSFDVTTGFYTLLGNIPGDWTGMEFDRASGMLYAIKTGSLYSIDITAMTSTLIGSMGLGADLSISLAIDSAGVGYIHNISNDSLYSVDLATGVATIIGATGFDANFGQGMCYDPTTDTVYMSAFNNTTFIAEWRSVDTATGMTTLIGPITTVNDPEPQVGWSSVGETMDPPACPKPAFLTVTDITETTAELNWVAEPNASNGYIWYVFEQGANPMTDTPVATGTTPAGTTNATATGLVNATSYDFYVVADCDTDGLSAYAGPVNFSTVITPPACGGKFYDTGGPDANYDNNENITTVISPDAPGDFVTVTFNTFNVESGWDALYVYDGPDANSPIISSGNPATNGGFPAGGYYGTVIPGPFSSTHESGALTFVFRSEGSVNYFGWDADVTCAMYPPPNDMIVNSINVGAIGFPYTDPAVRMPAATTENGNPVDCDITGANGVWYHFTTTGEGTATANIVNPGGASHVTFYKAPGEGAVETDLVRVQQSSNACMPGTSADVNLEANQIYYVFVMNSGAVTDIQIDATILGISNNILEGFTYYPNPTNGILNLNSKNTIEMVSIYNLLGQKVIDSRVKAESTILDISSLSTGTYVMKVTVDGQIGTYKLLKQ